MLQLLRNHHIFMLILVTFALVKHSQAKYASQCITPQNEAGICVPVKSCARTYASTKNWENLKAKQYDNTMTLLKQTQCGNENDMPYVCCPSTELQINPDIYEYLSKLDCGISSDRRIAHGEIADIYAYRWSALLVYEGKKFRCGGALISERYVLSAAHCYQNFGEVPIAVRLGEYDLSTEVDCIQTRKGPKCLEPYEDIEIEKSFLHEDYIFRDLHHDIALIRLARPVVFKKHIRPICLPITKELQTSRAEWYLVAGWGRTETATASDILRFTNIPYQTHEFCREKLRLSRSQNLTAGHICAGGEHLRDSCKGDSGSAIFLPSFYVNGVVRNVQFGIVSLGVASCGEISAPAIYTNVSHYMQWITDHMSLD